MAKDRKASEEKVLAAVREQLPKLAEQDAITICFCDERDPDVPDDAVFTVTRYRAHTFTRRRGA